MTINGYEIRLELLKMAKELLEQDWHAHRDIILNDYNNQVSFARNKAESAGYQSTQFPSTPIFRPFPTELEIIAKAKTLNEFVTARN